MRTVLVASILMTVVIGSASMVRDFFTKRQIIVATPTPTGVFTHPEVKLAPNQNLCMAPVTFPTDADLALMTAVEPKKLGLIPNLRVTVTAGNKRLETLIRGEHKGLSAISAAVPQNPRAAQGRVCVRNVGIKDVALGGTGEPRFQTLTKTTIDDRPASSSVSISLAASRPQTLISRVDDAVTRASDFSGGLSPVLLWLLVAAVVIGIPAATIAAMVSSFRPRD